MLYFCVILVYNNVTIMYWRSFMSELNDLCKKVKNVADRAVKKTEEIADSAAKHIKLHRIDSKLSDRYENLGKLTYKQLKTGESQAERIAAYIESIDKLRADRKSLQAEIEADRARREAEKAAREAAEEAEEEAEDAE